jgi:hypothetical protein
MNDEKRKSGDVAQFWIGAHILRGTPVCGVVIGRLPTWSTMQAAETKSHLGSSTDHNFCHVWECGVSRECVEIVEMLRQFIADIKSGGD